MKARHGVWTVLIALMMAAPGSTVSALEGPQHAVASQATDTKTATDGPQVLVRVPLFSPQSNRVPIAMVNDDPITLGDLSAALGTAHEERDPAKEGAGGKIDYHKILDRLINVKLVVQEATKIGFDELPEFKTAVDDYSATTLGQLLMKEATKDAKAEPAAVEKLYKQMVEEWKIKSVFFEKEDDAKSMADALKAGASYEDLAAKAVADKKVKGVEEGGFINPGALEPHIRETIATMGTGSVSPLIRVQSAKTTGFTIIKLEDKRYPENPAVREQAERSVLAEAQAREWEKYKTSLVTKYVKVHEKTVKGLDLEKSVKKFPELLKDKRVVADIKDEKPITVGDLTQELANKFWHGVEEAAKAKKLNKEIRPTLFLLIGKRVITKEVANRGIVNSDEYQKELKDFKDSRLFSLFVERVIFPDITVKESDLKAYFESHKKDYQYPEMMKMTSLAFENKASAESALKTLQKGSDINWVRSNAEGVVPRSDEDPLTSLSGSILSANSISPGMAKAVAGARAGEYRLYQGAEGRFYVLLVEDIIPARPQPYEEVREPISKKVLDEKFIHSIEEWFSKLRAASSIKLYLTDTPK